MEAPTGHRFRLTGPQSHVLAVERECLGRRIMLYRESGQYKTSYISDQAIFPIREDRIGMAIIGLIALAIPFVASDFFLNAIMTPFLILALAAIGLNILTGYAGQLSLGTGAFMGVGAYSCYKLTTIFPDVNIILLVLLSGLFSAGIGVIFGLPSLRIKGLYLAVTTLAAQFFLEWCFIRIPWLYNYNSSGAIEVPERRGFGDIILTGPAAGADHPVFCGSGHRGCGHACGEEHRARAHRPSVDDDPRHGHRG
jgi:branched-chain amino acid transport system permease protein